MKVSYSFSRLYDALRKHSKNIDMIGLGENTHGTSEIYTTRARTTLKFIKNIWGNNIIIIFVECDWFDISLSLNNDDGLLESKIGQVLDSLKNKGTSNHMWNNHEFEDFLTLPAYKLIN